MSPPPRPPTLNYDSNQSLRPCEDLGPLQPGGATPPLLPQFFSKFVRFHYEPLTPVHQTFLFWANFKTLNVGREI